MNKEQRKSEHYGECVNQGLTLTIKSETHRMAQLAEVLGYESQMVLVSCAWFRRSQAGSGLKTKEKGQSRETVHLWGQQKAGRQKTIYILDGLLRKGEKILKLVSPLPNKIKYQHHMHFKKILTSTSLERSHFMLLKKKLLAKSSGLPNYSATHVIIFCFFFFIKTCLKKVSSFIYTSSEKSSVLF